MKPTEAHNLMKLGLDDTPDEGTPRPIPTDRALLLFAAFNNIFRRAGEQYAIPPSKPLNGDGPCLSCRIETCFPYNGNVWCCNTKCEAHP